MSRWAAMGAESGSRQGDVGAPRAWGTWGPPEWGAGVWYQSPPGRGRPTQASVSPGLLGKCPMAMLK